MSQLRHMMVLCHMTTSYLVESPPSCLLGLHLGEVVVIRHQVGHDGLVIRTRSVHICIWRGKRHQGMCTLGLSRGVDNFFEVRGL